MSERKDVVIIGAGQAGLAMGYHLSQQGLDFTILDAATEPAAAWRSRWESLKLFTPARYCGLPGRDFPGDPESYPSRDDVIDYLEAYARDFALPVEFDSAVRRLRKVDDGYLVELDDRSYAADQVVVATGPFQVPRVPARIAEGLDPRVTQLHSSRYLSPSDLPSGRVLLVGGGNTGYQIAEELAGDSNREVHLSVGSRQVPLPRRPFGRELFSLLETTGMMATPVTSRLGRLLKDREALIGSSPRQAKRQGIRLKPRTRSASGWEIVFDDDTTLAVDGVIWATGFDTDHAWIDAPIFDSAGRVAHARGVTGSPGLFFLGLPWLHTRGSALLGWVKDDAAHIAQQVASAARFASHVA